MRQKKSSASGAAMRTRASCQTRTQRMLYRLQAVMFLNCSGRFIWTSWASLTDPDQVRKQSFSEVELQTVQEDSAGSKRRSELVQAAAVAPTVPTCQAALCSVLPEMKRTQRVNHTIFRERLTCMRFGSHMTACCLHLDFL